MNTQTEANEQWTFNERHTRLRTCEPTQLQSEWWSIVGIGNEFALDVITPPCVSRERNVEISRLIAAAPELLEALRAVLPLLDIAFSYEGDVFGSSYNAAGDADDQARAAIAKATGGAQ